MRFHIVVVLGIYALLWSGNGRTASAAPRPLEGPLRLGQIADAPTVGVVAYSPDGVTLADARAQSVAGENDELYWQQAQQRRKEAEQQDKAKRNGATPAKTVAIAPPVVAGGMPPVEGAVRIWDVSEIDKVKDARDTRRVKMLHLLSHPGAQVKSMAFSPDGKWLAVGVVSMPSEGASATEATAAAPAAPATGTEHGAVKL